jgi:superfamily II DNA or RNA helicase
MTKLVKLYIDNIMTRIETDESFSVDILRIIEDAMSYTITEYDRFRKEYIDYKYSLMKRATLEYPTGLFSHLVRILDSFKIQYEIYDNRIKPDSKNSLELLGRKARDYQQQIIENAVECERGIIKVATGGGKTTIAGGIIAKLNLKTLFVVNSIDLLEQAADEFEKMLGINIGRIGGGYCDIKQINVCTIQTLFSALGLKVEAKEDELFFKEKIPEKTKAKKEEIINVVKNCEVILNDECFPAEAMILIDIDKVVTIKDIYENKKITHVVSYNFEKKIYEKKKIIYRFKNKCTDKWYRISYSIEGKNYSFKCTGNHKIWTVNRGYVQAKDLVIGNDILKFNDSNPKRVKFCIDCDYVGSPLSTSAHHSTIHKGNSWKRIDYEKRSKNLEWKRKLSERQKGENNSANDPEIRKRILTSWKKNWENKTEEQKAKFRENWINAPVKSKGKVWKPTSFEQKIIDLNISEIAYTGDGKFWLAIGKKDDGKRWSKNPDFKIRGQRKVIEVGDIVHWHTKEEIERVIKGYESINFKCLYLINEDFEVENFENTLGKIQKFIFNHDEAIVTGVKYLFSASNKSVENSFRYNIEVEDNHNYFANNVLVSNCQHCSARSYTYLMTAAQRSHYRFGLSGTPYKDASTDIILDAYAGKLISNVSATYLIERGFLVKPKIYFLDPNKLGGYKFIRGHGFQRMYKEWIVKNKKRNTLIVVCVERLLELGRTPLVTIARIEHGERIEELIAKRIPSLKMAFIRGEVNKEDRKKMLNAIRSKNLNLLIGSSVADEGLDMPVLDSAIIAGGGKSLIKSLQRVGRTLRPYPSAEANEKDNAIIVDFYDNLRFLTGQSRKRMEIYRQESAFEIIEDFKNK